MFSFEKKEITFDYTNWEGKKATRRAIVERIYFGSTDYHPEPQWIMVGMNVDKQAEREYAMNDMSHVIEVKN